MKSTMTMVLCLFTTLLTSAACAVSVDDGQSQSDEPKAGDQAASPAAPVSAEIGRGAGGGGGGGGGSCRIPPQTCAAPFRNVLPGCDAYCTLGETPFCISGNCVFGTPPSCTCQGSWTPPGTIEAAVKTAPASNGAASMTTEPSASK